MKLENCYPKQGGLRNPLFEGKRNTQSLVRNRHVYSDKNIEIVRKKGSVLVNFPDEREQPGIGAAGLLNRDS
jgi:hypothetical protein